MLGSALGLAACGVPTSAEQTPQSAGLNEQGAQRGLDVVPLTITSGGKTHRFSVEVARTNAQQQTGMMYRRHVAPDRGMLFPYETAQPVSFWMMNTFIPLDLLFIRDDGSIARIAANAEPLSLDPIPSQEPIVAVLEIGGGRAAQLGIEPGDKVSWR